MRRTVLFFILISFYLVSCSQGEKWIDLFNGKDLQGWRVLNGSVEFKVENGVIIGISTMNTPNTFLATEKEYNDFILEYEAKIDSGLNSGVQIRSLSTPDYRDGRVRGYQVEIDPSARAWTRGIYDEARRGCLENVKSPQTTVIPQISYLTNQPTEGEIREGWQLLWDGKTTAGWRGAKSESFPTTGWKIEDGILKVMKSGGGESAFGGDIITQKKYKDFILEVDFKITPGANSGIKYFVDPELNKGAGSAIGCEFQILDDRLHPDAKKGTAGNRTLASLYDLIPANAQFYAPYEPIKRENRYGWNRARIVVHGNHVEHYLNGIKVVEYERRTQMWRALVARSKYVIWQNFGELEQGNILLQDHGDEVWFRNIKIKVEE